MDDNTISIIDENTLGVNTLALEIPENTLGDYYPSITAISPHSVAVDTVRNKIYVVNTMSSNVTVLDGADNNRIFIMKSTGYWPSNVAVNTILGKFSLLMN